MSCLDEVSDMVTNLIKNIFLIVRIFSFNELSNILCNLTYLFAVYIAKNITNERNDIVSVTFNRDIEIACLIRRNIRYNITIVEVYAVMYGIAAMKLKSISVNIYILIS